MGETAEGEGLRDTVERGLTWLLLKYQPQTLLFPFSLLFRFRVGCGWQY